MNITTKQFQILTDVNLVWDFLTEIYDRETGSGVAAPFCELDNTDSQRFHRAVGFEEANRIVAYVKKL